MNRCPKCGEPWSSRTSSCFTAEPKHVPPVPELEGAFPVVLYFPTEQDRDGFIEIVKQAKPNMVTRNL